MRYFTGLFLPWLQGPGPGRIPKPGDMAAVGDDAFEGTAAEATWINDQCLSIGAGRRTDQSSDDISLKRTIGRFVPRTVRRSKQNYIFGDWSVLCCDKADLPT